MKEVNNSMRKDSNELNSVKQILIAQPIKLKSFTNKRYSIPLNKTNTSLNQSLTDYKFKCKVMNHALKNNLESKLNLTSLQLEIALATSKALSSIKRFNSIKQSSTNYKSSFRSSKPEATSSESSLIIKESILFDINHRRNSIKNDQASINYLKTSSNSPKILQIANNAPKTLYFKTPEHHPLKENRHKETIFIDKLREATIKLRHFREISK